MGVDVVVEPPFDKSKNIGSFWDWKDVYFGEYLNIWRMQFVTAVGGFDAEQAKNYSDT